MMMSAFVAPGVGQLLQRRWFAAAFFGLGFLAVFVAFGVCAARILVTFYRVGLSPESMEDPRLSVVPLLVTLGLGLVVWGWGLVDTYLGERRRLAREFRERTRKVHSGGTDPSVY
jgi:hypothetical protein